VEEAAKGRLHKEATDSVVQRNMVHVGIFHLHNASTRSKTCSMFS
jgi:hypothetical protein